MTLFLRRKILLGLYGLSFATGTFSPPRDIHPTPQAHLGPPLRIARAQIALSPSEGSPTLPPKEPDIFLARATELTPLIFNTGRSTKERKRELEEWGECVNRLDGPSAVIVSEALIAALAAPDSSPEFTVERIPEAAQENKNKQLFRLLFIQTASGRFQFRDSSPYAIRQLDDRMLALDLEILRRRQTINSSFIKEIIQTLVPRFPNNEEGNRFAVKLLTHPSLPHKWKLYASDSLVPHADAQSLDIMMATMFSHREAMVLNLFDLGMLSRVFTQASWRYAELTPPLNSENWATLLNELNSEFIGALSERGTSAVSLTSIQKHYDYFLQQMAQLSQRTNHSALGAILTSSAATPINVHLGIMRAFWQSLPAQWDTAINSLAEAVKYHDERKSIAVALATKKQPPSMDEILNLWKNGERNLCYLVISAHSKNRPFLKKILIHEALPIEMKLHAFAHLYDKETDAPHDTLQKEFKHHVNELRTESVDFLKSLLGDDQWITRIKVNPFPDQEVIPIYTAVLIALSMDHPDEAAQWMTAAHGILGVKVTHGHASMNANLQIGYYLLGVMTNSLILLAMGHEWGHRLFPIENKTLLALVVEEVGSDAMAYRLAKVLDVSLEQYTHYCRFTLSDERIGDNNNWGSGEHRIARAFQTRLAKAIENIEHVFFDPERIISTIRSLAERWPEEGTPSPITIFNEIATGILGISLGEEPIKADESPDELPISELFVHVPDREGLLKLLRAA